MQTHTLMQSSMLRRGLGLPVVFWGYQGWRALGAAGFGQSMDMEVIPELKWGLMGSFQGL